MHQLSQAPTRKMKYTEENMDWGSCQCWHVWGAITASQNSTITQHPAHLPDRVDLMRGQKKWMDVIMSQKLKDEKEAQTKRRS